MLYTLLGGLLFIMPEILAPVFAWKVTAFTTMTIGGWCLGNAWLAFFVARRWQWNHVFSAFTYLWLFGFFELIVLITFRDKLRLTHPIAWLYLITLLVNLLSAVVGVYEYIRKPMSAASEVALNPWQRVVVVVFVIFVGFLGIYGTTAQIGDFGTNGGIFPEVMSLFTLRSFGVFYLALALGVAPYLWNHNFHGLLFHSMASYGLILFITAAAFVHFNLFDFATRPGGLLYFGAYLGVGIPLLFAFRKYGSN
jgi:hypothetical protein